MISALGAEEILMLGIGASGASDTAVSGVIDTLVVMNKVNARVGNNARMRSGTRPADDADGDGEADGKSSSGDIDVEAEDHSVVYNFGGAVAISGSNGVGATIVTLVFDKEVQASIGTGGVTDATGDINVNAVAEDDLYLVAVTFSASGSNSVGLGASVLVFMNEVIAEMGGQVTAGGDINVKARDRKSVV